MTSIWRRRNGDALDVAAAWVDQASLYLDRLKVMGFGRVRQATSRKFRLLHKIIGDHHSTNLSDLVWRSNLHHKRPVCFNRGSRRAKKNKLFIYIVSATSRLYLPISDLTTPEKGCTVFCKI